MKKTKVRRIRRRKQTRRRKIRGGIGKVVPVENTEDYRVYLSNPYNKHEDDNTPFIVFQKIKGTDYWRSYWSNVVDLFNNVVQTKTDVNDYMFKLKGADNAILYNSAVAAVAERNTNGNMLVTGFKLNDVAKDKFCVLTKDQINGLAKCL